MLEYCGVFSKHRIASASALLMVLETVGCMPAMMLKMDATPNLNKCGRSKPALPLQIRVATLPREVSLNGLTQVEVWEHEQETLGAIGPVDTLVLNPGQVKPTRK